MIIPRERKLVRIYVQVSSELASNYWTNGGDPEVIMMAVRNIMQPYRFNASLIEWSTIYAVSELTRPQRRGKMRRPGKERPVANLNRILGRSQIL